MAVASYATPEALPPELHLDIFAEILSATDLQSYLLASPRAAATFLTYRREILINLLKRVLTPASLTTGLKIHHLELYPNATYRDLNDISRAGYRLSYLDHLDIRSLQTLYWLCLRHEPFVVDALDQRWLRDMATADAGTSHHAKWWDETAPSLVHNYWYRDPDASFTLSDESSVEWGTDYTLLLDRSFQRWYKVRRERLLGGFFVLELYLRSKGSNFDGRAVRIAAGFGEYDQRESRLDVMLASSALYHHVLQADIWLDRYRTCSEDLESIVSHGEGILLPSGGTIFARYRHLVSACMLKSPDPLRYEPYFDGHSCLWVDGEDVELNTFVTMAKDFTRTVEWYISRYGGDFGYLVSGALPQWNSTVSYDFDRKPLHYYNTAMLKALGWAQTAADNGNVGAKAFLEQGYMSKRKTQKAAMSPRWIPLKFDARDALDPPLRCQEGWGEECKFYCSNCGGVGEDHET